MILTNVHNSHPFLWNGYFQNPLDNMMSTSTFPLLWKDAQKVFQKAVFHLLYSMCSAINLGLLVFHRSSHIFGRGWKYIEQKTACLFVLTNPLPTNTISIRYMIHTLSISNIQIQGRYILKISKFLFLWIAHICVLKWHVESYINYWGWKLMDIVNPPSPSSHFLVQG